MKINFLCYWLNSKAIVCPFNENQRSLLLAQKSGYSLHFFMKINFLYSWLKSKAIVCPVNENQLSFLVAQQ